jgi:hypothetical protein
MLQLLVPMSVPIVLVRSRAIWTSVLLQIIVDCLDMPVEVGLEVFVAVRTVTLVSTRFKSHWNVESRKLENYAHISTNWCTMWLSSGLTHIAAYEPLNSTLSIGHSWNKNSRPKALANQQFPTYHNSSLTSMDLRSWYHLQSSNIYQNIVRLIRRNIVLEELQNADLIN